MDFVHPTRRGSWLSVFNACTDRDGRTGDGRAFRLAVRCGHSRRDRNVAITFDGRPATLGLIRDKSASKRCRARSARKRGAVRKGLSVLPLGDGFVSLDGPLPATIRITDACSERKEN